MFLSLTGSDAAPALSLRAGSGFVPVALAGLLLAACSTTAPHPHDPVVAAHGPVAHGAVAVDETTIAGTPALELRAVSNLQGIIPELAEKRVVFVGESHDRYDHHLNQLEIIRRLHELHPRLAIGMEMFQQPFQGVLDDYIAGSLSEQELLRGTEYYQRWRFDFRLYAPILRYARDQHIPVVALNLPAELTRKVGREGIDALTEQEQAQLPTDIDRSDRGYEQRIRAVFDHHPGNRRMFDNFLEVQLLWDEGMAERAADWLAGHPDYRMVVLAGAGHIAWRSGIPGRLARRLQSDSATVLNGWDGMLAPELGDFMLLSAQRTLPPAGKLGAVLDTGAGAPAIVSCKPETPCAQAGLRKGDRFLAIDDAPIESMADLRLALWDKLPGDTVDLRIQRSRWLLSPRELELRIELR